MNFYRFFDASMIDIQNFVNETFNKHWDIAPTSTSLFKVRSEDEKNTPMRTERMKYTVQLE